MTPSIRMNFIVVRRLSLIWIMMREIEEIVT